MVKHIFLTLLLSASTISVFADEVVMQSDEKGHHSSGGNHTEIPTPRVQADENTVEITCDSLVNHAEVIITDLNGVIMHYSSESLSPSNTLLFVTDTPDQYKYYIEIVADEQVFYGYF